MVLRILTVVGVCALAGSLALGQASGKQETKPAKPSKAPAAAGGAGAKEAQDAQPALPPGMTEEMMSKMMEAATPGPMHDHLMKSIGVWEGTVRSWMSPDAPATEMKCVTRIRPMMDKRFTRSDTKGDFGGMPFHGFAIYGYDNVGKVFQQTWVDTMGTGMMTGTGTMSEDGKSIEWTCTYNCPLEQCAKEVKMVEKWTGPETMVLEMYTADPVSKKVFKSMEIAYTRTSKDVREPSAEAGETPARVW